MNEAEVLLSELISVKVPGDIRNRRAYRGVVRKMGES